ncbi:hypothetical protein BV898_12344 [Hypsibius exemplaris]|uniref:Small integral membrane protein 4 n=1 Tax=Hypsibius exemplaris TaxID=2072580 RepID=A0A1W0WDW6_HYPEX|nr:hypothetical protein BV898_12344 [Hypsibius exemplaris]
MRLRWGLGKILDAWPGKRYFGAYRLMPLFFIFGGLVEFAMIHLSVGNVNFYDVYKRKHPEQVAALRKKGIAAGLGEEEIAASVQLEAEAQLKFISGYEEYLKTKAAPVKL